MSADVVIYATRSCGYCSRVRTLLDRKGVWFEEITVDRDPGRREEMIRRSGRRTVPQIFIGDRHVGGCDELYALERSGRLDALLQAPPGAQS